jgi:hypothetical protein
MSEVPFNNASISGGNENNINVDSLCSKIETNAITRQLLRK